MRREIERFDAESEDGDRVTIIRWQKVIDTGAQDGTRIHAAGLDSFTTDDGNDVRLIDDDTFGVVRTEMIVRRVQS